MRQYTLPCSADLPISREFIQQKLSSFCHSAVFTVIRLNRSLRHADLPQKPQCGRTLSLVVPTCRCFQPLFSEIMLLSCRSAVFTAMRQNHLPHRVDIPQNRQCGRTLCRAQSTCRYHEPSYSSKNVAFLPFCYFYGKITKQFAVLVRYAAISAKQQTSLLWRGDLPISWAFILSKNCYCFAVLPVLRPCGKTVCRAVPICRIIDNAAEPYAVPCRLSNITSLCQEKLSPFCRSAVFTAVHQNRSTHRANMPQSQQCGRTLSAVQNQLTCIMILYTTQKFWPICCFVVFTAKWQNLMLRRADIQQNRQQTQVFCFSFFFFWS